MTLAPTPSIMNLVVRIPVPPTVNAEDDAAAPPIAPPSRLKLSNPKAPPTAVPDLDRLLVVDGGMLESPVGWVFDVPRLGPVITLVVVV